MAEPADLRRSPLPPGGLAAPGVDVLFNPFDPDTRADPYPAYRLLRESAPVHRPFEGLWVLSRYRDIVEVFRAAGVSSDRRKSPLYQAFLDTLSEPELIRAIPPSMLFLDPPDHTRLRGLVNRAFTARRVEALRPRIEELVRGLLDGAEGRGEMDVVADLAYPLPVAVICDLLAVPDRDRGQVRRWSTDLIYTLDPIFTDEVLHRAETAGLAFRGYIGELIAERRKAPGDDLLSGMIQAEDEGKRLSEEEVISTCVLLLVAGHETTSGLIGNGTLALLRDRNQLDRLREDPALVRSGVEELLRYDGPVQLTGRLTLEEVGAAGERIPKHSEVVLLLGAANHDPEAFEDPDRLDLARKDNHHLGFGSGIHFCLGAPLARLEAQVAIPELLRRFPRMELATDHPEWRDTVTLRALRSLPVAL